MEPRIVEAGMDFDFALFCKRRIRDDVRGSKRGRGRSTFLYPCRKGGVMETFMSDFIVVSIL
jgi:hypothetical protein